MKAAYYEQFRQPITIATLPDPTPGPGDAVLKVMATGLCRSDWHGWMGHDADIHLPHVPGHELAGIIVETGKEVRHWKKGDRVTVPFCGGCGDCPQCQTGNQQICDHYFQPGFTAWGSFAEFVNIQYADHNLVRLPDDMEFATAAVMGCRFITAFRGIVAQGKLGNMHSEIRNPKSEIQWVAVHGCGGVGLSAVMIASAYGARVIAVDIDEEKLAFAKKMGAVVGLNARQCDVVEAILEHTKGGAHLSLDALGSRETCRNSILCLRKRGRHVQLGLLAGTEADPPLPMGAVISKELEIIGSHGMQAHQYPLIFEMINAGKLRPELMIGNKVSLEAGVLELMDMNSFKNIGVTVII